MSDKQLKLQVILGAVDRMTRPIRQAVSGNAELAKKLKDNKEALKKLQAQQSDISSFRELTAKTKASSVALAEARQRLAAMRTELAAAGDTSEKAMRKLTSQQIAVDKLTAAHKQQLAASRASRQQLEQSGVRITKLASHERELAGKIDSTTAAMARQQAQLKRMSEYQNRQRGARSQYEHGLENRDRLAGAGASTLAAGSAVGLPIVSMVKDYSAYEDAMLGIARQVDGARDANGRLTAIYHGMGTELKALSEKIPLATTELIALAEGGARMGIKGRAELLAFTKTAALSANAFDLPAEQISESLGKVANGYKIPIKNIEQLGDTINWLDDNAQSKGADIIDVLQRIAGNTGSMSYKEAAALGSTFLSLGASSEVAATGTRAMIRELSMADKQPKRFQVGLKALGLTAKQVQAGMARDSTGTIMKVMEAINKLPKAEKMGVVVDLFGKEYGDDAAKLADNLKEYRKQLALVNDVKAQGSMQREGDAKNDTLSAQYQITKNKLFNQQAALGETLRAPLMDIMNTVGDVLASINAWTKANPELTATLMKIAAGAAAIMVVLGGMMLAIAGVLGPFLVMRFAMQSLGISLTSGIGIIGKVGSALRIVGSAMLWVGRVLLMNPIGLIVTAIAAAAYLLWQNWGSIGPKFAALWQYIKTSAISALAWFQTLPARFTEFGSNLMSGLVRGITNGLASVKAAITGAGASTISWFKEKLGIHSPSRVFAQLGGWTMEGLGIGMNKGASHPLTQLTGLADQLSARARGMSLLLPDFKLPALPDFKLPTLPSLSLPKFNLPQLPALASSLALGATSGLALAANVPIDQRPPINSQRPAVAAAAPVYHISITAAPGMDAQALARAVAAELDKRDRAVQARGRSKLGDHD